MLGEEGAVMTTLDGYCEVAIIAIRPFDVEFNCNPLAPWHGGPLLNIVDETWC
jgi:hypothetical protein